MTKYPGMDTSQQARIARLRVPHDEFLAAASGRRMQSPKEAAEVRQIAEEVFARTREPAEVLRRAEFLEAFAERVTPRIRPDELIVGSQLFNGFRRQAPGDDPARQFHGNMGHVVVDHGRVLRKGVAGLRAEIAEMPRDEETQRRNQEAFGRALDAFSVFIRRHGQTAEHPPRTFWEALQLVWFTQVFLHAEASAQAISFCRLDQYMWPYLERDLAEGRLTMDDAEELLACFWLKCCEGCESQNLIVGGVNEAGCNAENPLSLLCLKVTRGLAVWQPSVSVRIAADTSDEFWDEALRLCEAGVGMPSFFNDPVVIRSLEAVNVPIERARDWAVVGCYEAAPQGDCCSQTVAGQWVLPTCFLGYFEQCGEPDGFDAFLAGLRDHMEQDYARCVERFQQRWDWMREHQASPFESLCLTGCTESGLTAEEAGARFNLFGVNVLGLGTLVDSVLAVKQLVYDMRALSLDDLRSHVKANWPDEATRAQCRNLPGKYGADAADSNALANDLAHHIADLVLASRLGQGVRPNPGLFIFTGWAQMVLPATPDGRRDGEPVSYGVGPSALVQGKTPTSIMNSAALAANDRCACGNPLLISLNRNDARGEAGRRRVRQMVETYFQAGGFHLHFNFVDAAQLREAKAHPEQHADLVMRISGLSAQFVTLDERLKDALVERTAQGM